MSAAPSPRALLGALLLRKGLVTPVELEGALEAQRSKGGMLGEILVRSGLASRPAIEDALAEQHGRRIESEAGFGTGLRSQMASRRPGRGIPDARVAMPGAAGGALEADPINAVRPALAAVPDEPATAEPAPAPEAIVRSLPVERREPQEARGLSEELLSQVQRWQRLADGLRDEAEGLRQEVAQRDRTLAMAYEQIEEAAEKLVESERKRRDENARAEHAEERAARAEQQAEKAAELGRALVEECERRERVEAALEEAHALLAARNTELSEAREELAAARREAAEHVVLIRAGERSEVVARRGPPPRPAARVELEGSTYVVVKLGTSPIQGDDRTCAFLEPA